MCGDMNFVRALSALIVGALHLEMIGLRGLPSLCVLTWEKIMGAVQWDGGVQALAKLIRGSGASFIKFFSFLERLEVGSLGRIWHWVSEMYLQVFWL